MCDVTLPQNYVYSILLQKNLYVVANYTILHFNKYYYTLLKQTHKASKWNKHTIQNFITYLKKFYDFEKKQ